MDKDILYKIKAFAFDVDGVFTDGKVLAMPDGDLLRSFNSKDCFGVRMAVDNGFPCAFITGGCSQSLIQRARSLGVKDEDMFQLSKNKWVDFEFFCKRHGFAADEVAFMGDDLPDVPALEKAGLPACPADAVAEVRETVETNGFVSSRNGGAGCVRELIESVMKAQGRWVFDPSRPWTCKHPDHITKFANMTGKNV